VACTELQRSPDTENLSCNVNVNISGRQFVARWLRHGNWLNVPHILCVKTFYPSLSEMWRATCRKKIVISNCYATNSSPPMNRIHNPNNYGKALMSAIPQAITPKPHTNLLNVYIHIYIYIYIANKMEFQQKKKLLCVWVGATVILSNQDKSISGLL
jgi:hypothetical protein